MHTHIRLHSTPLSPILGPWMGSISPAAESRSAKYIAGHDKLSLELDGVEAESGGLPAVHNEPRMIDTPHTRGLAIRLTASDDSPTVYKARSRRVEEFDEESSAEVRSTEVSEKPSRINPGRPRTSNRMAFDSLDAEHATRPPSRLRKHKLSLAYQIDDDKEVYEPPSQSDGSGE